MVQSLNHGVKPESITWIFETVLDVIWILVIKASLWLCEFIVSQEQKTILEQAMRPGGSLGAPILSVFLSVTWWFGFLGSLWEKLLLRATLTRIAKNRIQSTNLPVDSCRLFVPRYADKLAAAAKLWALAQDYSAVQDLSLTSSSDFLLFAFCWVSSQICMLILPPRNFP